MRRTTRPLALIAAVVVVYCAVLIQVGPTSPVEKFPVFKWQLFSKVPPAVNTSYGVRILEVDGEVLDPPRYFEESRDLFRLARSPDASVLTRSWGGHHTSGRLLRADSSRKLFEARFLAPATSVRYEFVERRYDIIDRVSCECYLSEEVLGAYRTG